MSLSYKLPIKMVMQSTLSASIIYNLFSSLNLDNGGIVLIKRLKHEHFWGPQFKPHRCMSLSLYMWLHFLVYFMGVQYQFFPVQS